MFINLTETLSNFENLEHIINNLFDKDDMQLWFHDVVDMFF